MTAFERTKIYDLAAASPLIAFYGWSAWAAWPPLRRELAMLAGGQADGAAAADALVRFLSLVFVSLLVLLLLLRRLPVGKSYAWFPRAAAALGTFAGVGFLQLPEAALAPIPFALSLLLIGGGTCATIVALLWLGRSFSIMPEARRLVMRGPYRLVRHPVYLFEEVTLFGMMLQHVQPWSAFLLATQLALQLIRIHYEEEVLAAHFPDYAAYAAKTARLIPGVY
jgi:protein-S-isoprenylcysteine O-methyltransferase Ste14